MIWILFAILTALAMVAVLHPLLGRGKSDALAAPSEAAFYRDQLAEIDRDAARGLLSEADAESARVEAARRLLRAAPASDAAKAEGAAKADNANKPAAGKSASASPGKAPPASSRGGARLAAAAVILVLVPLFTIGLYLRLGQPERADEPLAARRANANDIESLVAKVEQRLVEHPEDARGHEVLGPVYMRMGRFEKAEHAFSEAVRLLGPNPQRLLGLAEARLSVAQGVVTDKTREALEQALALDPKNARAQFLLGVAAEQDQKPEKAKALYEKIIAEAAPDAPYLPIVRERLASVGGEAPAPSSPGAPPMASGAPPMASGMPTGPAAEAIAALPPEQRQAQIRAMVEGLATRLSQNGQDVQGWLRLIRSWKMLGEQDKAVAALADARKALAGDAAALGQVESLAKELGVGE